MKKKGAVPANFLVRNKGVPRDALRFGGRLAHHSSVMLYSLVTKYFQGEDRELAGEELGAVKVKALRLNGGISAV